jgi:putative membrane protein
MEEENIIQQEIRNEAAKESDPRVHLSVERTELAWERTQLAWIRTVLGFLASGIALDKGLESMRKARIESGDAFFANTHIIGIILSITGTLLMLISTWLYIRRSYNLAKQKGVKPMWFPPGVIASLLIVILGLGISFLLLVS